MRAWEDRSTEEANLLNPSFLSLLCYQVIKEYCKNTTIEAPYPLPFLAVPLVLYKQTRDSLPSSVRTTFASWALSADGSQAKSKYAIHSKSLVPVIKESIAFAIKNQILSINQNGNIEIGAKKIHLSAQHSFNFTDEVNDCIKRSAFCGRWFAHAGRIETIMALLGVKP